MLKQIRLTITRGLLSSLLVLFSIAPLSTGISFAEDCVPPESSGPGVNRPVGSDAAMYTYNCDTGKWVSSRYTFDPATGQYTANEPLTYTYNPSTGKYDTKVWAYNAPQGDYVQVPTSVAQPPAGANVIGGPAPAAPSSTTNTGSGSNNSSTTNTGSGNSIDNTGANSNNTIGSSNSTNTTANNENLLTIHNMLNATATTGNAMVLQNTNGGSATSGDASNTHNIVNMLQSTGTDLGSGNVVTFVYDIDGDVNGDLLFDPAALGNVQPANADPSGSNNLTINNETDASITNDITLNSTSGNATVSENTTGGDATSGNAKAVANIVNLINSAVSSGKSFIGTININGNLNGDILLPPDFIDQLIAANIPTVDIIVDTGAGSNNTINDSSSNNTKVTNSNDLGITNNVNATATSGNANVSENTNAGSATSGHATNSITAFNLTGSNYIGRNALLVFVNVTGKWVGLIVNAPAGSNAAALGGGGNSISNTGANSNNNIDDSESDSTTVNSNTKQRITNNIDINATSGDANVTRNTNGGNAKTGNADTAVNLMNIQNSSLSLSNWFGILFINVFGTWNGSFGVNTSAGDPVAMAQASGGSTGPSMRVFGFVPNGGSNTTSSGSWSPYSGNGDEQAVDMHTASTSLVPTGIGSTGGDNGSQTSGSAQGQVNWPLIIGSGTLFAGYLLADRYGNNLRRPGLKFATKLRSLL